MSHKTEDIRSKAGTKEYRDNYDRIFKKAGVVQLEERLSCEQDLDGSNPSSGTKYDETVDWGEFNTNIYCTDDPNFGG